jgi:hypothetical protein
MSVPALVNQRLLPKYLSAASGNSYLALSNLSAGLAIPIFSNTAQTMVLWNKSVNKNISLQSLTIGLVSGAVAIVGDLGFAVIIAGTGLGTPISANVAIATCYQMNTFNAAASADFSWCSATVVAPTLFLPSGIVWTDVYAIASTTQGPSLMFRDYDGSLIIPPGVAFCFCGMAAQTQLSHVAIQFEVIPVAIPPL